MNRWLCACVLLLVAIPVCAQIKPAAKPESAPALTEVQQLQAKMFVLEAQVFELQKANAELRATLSDRETRLASLYLTEQQADLAKRKAALEAEYLKTLKAPDGSTWDWDKMIAVPAKGKE